MDNSKIKVYVGMSGGVDSSLTAALLKEQGYNVVGVYMKNWTQDLPGMKCPWAEDLADAKRVAVQLGIDFKVFDFEKNYREKVVQYMLDEYAIGRTPNPDIMCNQEVKFKLFLEAALEDGADLIATGHYAGVRNVFTENTGDSFDFSKSGNGELLRAKDENKDQTYFFIEYAVKLWVEHCFRSANSLNQKCAKWRKSAVFLLLAKKIRKEFALLAKSEFATF